MNEHELKILPEFYQPVIEGLKTFEIRSVLDRTFEVGDHVHLREFDAGTKRYTGRGCRVEITFITDYAQRDNHVVFSFVRFS